MTYVSLITKSGGEGSRRAAQDFGNLKQRFHEDPPRLASGAFGKRRFLCESSMKTLHSSSELQQLAIDQGRSRFVASSKSWENYFRKLLPVKTAYGAGQSKPVFGHWHGAAFRPMIFAAALVFVQNCFGPGFLPMRIQRARLCNATNGSACPASVKPTWHTELPIISMFGRSNSLARSTVLLQPLPVFKRVANMMQSICQHMFGGPMPMECGAFGR